MDNGICRSRAAKAPSLATALVKIKGSGDLIVNEDVAPLSSLWMTRSKASVQGDLRSDHSKIGEVEDFFARVTTQLKDAQSPGINVKSPALKMSQYSAQVLNKTKAEDQKLLMMPLHKVVLPENYSVLVDALPIYAASPNLSVEKVHVLEELKKNLPSLFSDFCQAKKQQEEYHSKVDKKAILTGELTKGLELYNDVKQRHSEIDTQISELKASLRKGRMKKRAIEEQELNLKNENSPKLTALEELRAVLVSEKELADSLTTKADVSWVDYKQKIIGLGI